MKKQTLSIVLGLFLAFLTGCTSSAGAPLPTPLPTGSIPLGELEKTNIILESNNLVAIGDGFTEGLMAALLSQEDEATSCHLETPMNGYEGLCLTPINMTGKASAIGLGVSFGAVPARLFGGSIGGISLDRNGELEVSPFNLADPLTMQGTSNLEDGDPESEWDRLLVYAAYVDIQAQIKQEFWTVRLAFTSQQPADEEALQDCVDDGYLQSIRANSGLLDDEETQGTFRKGDMLLCKKSSVDETCLDSEFQWLDLDTGQFVSTRPSNPQQHAWADNDEVSCSSNGNGRGYEINLGSYDLIGVINEPFQLTAENRDCEKIYTYTNLQTSSVSEGNTLTARFDFNMENAVFLKDLSHLAVTPDVEIFEAFTLQQLLFRSEQEVPDAYGTDGAGVTVATEITITEDDSLTCGDKQSIDDVYFTGEECTPDGEIKSSCTQEACTPDFESVDGTIWSSKGTSSANNSCTEYCTRQSCPEYNGTTRNIYCIPDC